MRSHLLDALTAESLLDRLDTLRIFPDSNSKEQNEDHSSLRRAAKGPYVIDQTHASGAYQRDLVAQALHFAQYVR